MIKGHSLRRACLQPVTNKHTMYLTTILLLRLGAELPNMENNAQTQTYYYFQEKPRLHKLRMSDQMCDYMCDKITSQQIISTSQNSIVL